jgi:phage terminase large subunit-like protein
MPITLDGDPFVTALARLPAEERRAFLARLSAERKASLLYTWPALARPGQLPPEGDWRCWLLLSGRGYGKTRAGAEWVRQQVEEKGRRRVAIVAATAADARDVMVEGESGILAVSRPGFIPRYEPSKRRLIWPNGAIATTYSADEPRALRGPQHDAAWCDELAAWRYPEAWDMLLLGLRLGDNPQVVVTTTPRPTALIRTLMAKPTTVVSRGTTYENRANLAPEFYDDIVRAYEGTDLSRQEIYGEVLEDLEGALWRRKVIDENRWGLDPQTGAPRVLPDLARIVVAVDPSVTSNEGSDETGIIVAGIDGPPTKAHAYVLADLSGRMSAEDWAREATAAYSLWQADCVVAEVNQGGDLVRTMIRMADPNARYRAVTATRGKFVRAEPAAGLYQQGRVHHVGVFPRLEDQMCRFTVDMDRTTMGSPDRVDALVWALYELIVRHRPQGRATSTTL